VRRLSCHSALQFEDFERANFVNQAFHAMWPFLDASICTAIRSAVQPIIQKNLPFPVSGFEFEKLAFGDSPWQVRGVKHYALYAGARCQLAVANATVRSWTCHSHVQKPGDHGEPQIWQLSLTLAAFILQC
jgi:hypothetical protein